MCAARLPQVVIVCDSRGKRLQELFYDDNHTIKVLMFSGAKLYQSAKLALSYLKRHMPDQIYILSGLNNLTTLDKNTRKVSLTAPEKWKIVQYFEDEINFTTALIRKNVTAKTKIIFVPITGMDLASYNRTTMESEQACQEIFNDALLDINKIIIARNVSNHCKTPWVHTYVHRYFRGRYHFYYEKLDTDGCHLTDEARSVWSRKLLSAIQANTLD